ncbi:carbohydrate esterase family 12 protein [Gonapodya prolifera JEL478]|uniref:Carbohydrate esterase family 12 protein n=1 Tax=Gonapodya prolifera (strain JEL478) TaxID=1344416 RepID=A0A139AKM9_GONPJ|nr:carbohydrate esterase family 12 protein [Gonapodya prolifera JEL478]|eukprot:KXS17352.1 carbohydrate esterase family 12 protein [Gonapodya prolifera JEL478]
MLPLYPPPPIVLPTTYAIAAPTVYLSGDSTMAPGSETAGRQGWGGHLKDWISLAVVNKAFPGRSARSFTREGRFNEIASLVKPGDFVVIEFGHNDGGSPNPTDNGRSACPGAGSETCVVVTSGNTKETVLTFPAYLTNAVNKFKSLGAKVIVSSQTPNNPWESGTFVLAPPRFVPFAEQVASQTGVSYVSHFQFAASAWQKAGNATTFADFLPGDHTHTNAAGARIVAEAFVRGLLCAVRPSGLETFISKTPAGQC